MNAAAPPRSTVAIDYDGTWTADPVAFEAFACLLARRGHTVILVTQRSTGHREVREAARCEGITAVVFAAKMSKRKACRAALFEVDIWIDDNPVSVGFEVARS